MFVAPAPVSFTLGSKDATYAQTPSSAALQMAVSVLCAEPCKELGRHLCDLCREQRVRKQQIEECKGEEVMTTWMPHSTVPVRLQTLQDGKTVVALQAGLFYTDPLF